jgi:predicted RNase H-like HicB family nuclease
MEIPVVIHKDSDSVYGVTVPDILGCHSWGETIEEAMKNARESIYNHVETLLLLNEFSGIHISPIDALKKNTDYIDGIWALVDIDLAKLDSKPERINISLPRFILKKIDGFAEARQETRSGFLARAALSLIAAESGSKEQQFDQGATTEKTN